MRVLQSISELKQLKDVLESTGHPNFKLSPLNVLRSTLRGFYAYEAVVDDWPVFKAFILRPNVEAIKNFRFRYTDVYLYSEGKNTMRTLLEYPGSLSWNEHFVIVGSDIKLAEVVEEVAKTHNGRLFYKEFETYVARNPDQLRSMKIPTGGDFTYGPIKPELIDLVINHWETYRMIKENWREHLAAIIANHPTVCAYNTKGEPVSWAVSYFDGVGGMAYTLPEYRGQRVYGIVGALLGKYAYEAGIDAHAYGSVSNTSVQKAVQKEWQTLPGYVFLGNYVPARLQGKL